MTYINTLLNIQKTIEDHSKLQLEKRKMTTLKEKEENQQFQEFWGKKNEELVYDSIIRVNSF